MWTSAWHGQFVEKLVERTKTIAVGDPTRRENRMGPVINDRALEQIQQAVEEAKADGGTIAVGGEVLTDGDAGSGCFPRRRW